MIEDAHGHLTSTSMGADDRSVSYWIFCVFVFAIYHESKVVFPCIQHHITYYCHLVGILLLHLAHYIVSFFLFEHVI